MKERIYILGGSGFVGKHLSVFLSDNYEVIVFDKWIDDSFFSSYSSIKTVMLDLVKEEIPISYPSPSFIINLASSLVTASRDVNNISNLMSDDIKILMNIFNRFNQAGELKLMIQFGSIEEYGNATSPYKETQREEPNSTYALLKQSCTNLTLLLHSNYGFPAMVVRPGNLFGPYQSESRFISYVYHQLLANKDLDVTACEQKRDFIYIKDFIRIVSKIMAKYPSFIGETVNVSSGKSTSLKNIIEQLKDLTASDSYVNYGRIPYRKNESMDLKCSIEKLERLLEEKINIDITASLIAYSKFMSIQCSKE